jgi:hypothetical protein
LLRYAHRNSERITRYPETIPAASPFVAPRAARTSASGAVIENPVVAIGSGCDADLSFLIRANFRVADGPDGMLPHQPSGCSPSSLIEIHLRPAKA